LENVRELPYEKGIPGNEGVGRFATGDTMWSRLDFVSAFAFAVFFVAMKKTMSLQQIEANQRNAASVRSEFLRNEPK
jgi:hypothetical protein